MIKNIVKNGAIILFLIHLYNSMLQRIREKLTPILNKWIANL